MEDKNREEESEKVQAYIGNCCVCCGEEVPEGRMVCRQCEVLD